MTTNEAEIKCPPSGGSVLSSSPTMYCPSESSSSSERRTERICDGRKKSSAGVMRMSPVSDCEVEAAASTTTSADGGRSCVEDAGSSSKFLGDDSSSRELVSSSTATNDTLGSIADSSTSAVERKATKKHSNKTKPGLNIVGKIAALGMEPDRPQFLEDLFAFMERRGTPIVTVPVICRQTVDLYRLYHLVKERSGMVEVSKGKRWRDVGSAMGIGGSTSAGFTLKRNYGRYLFPYECKFDRGDLDPVPLLAAMETPSRKDSRRRAAERGRDREIETEESQSSSSQLTGQPPRNNGFKTTHNLSGYNIDTTGNDGLMNVPASAYISSTGPAMNSKYQMGFPSGSAGNQATIDPTRSSGVNEQRSEFSTLQPFQASSSYALHSMECVRPSALVSDGRGISRSDGEYGRALIPAVVKVESPMASTTDEDGSNVSYRPTMSTSRFPAVGGQVKGERSEEATSAGFPNILQPIVTSASDKATSGDACEVRATRSSDVPLTASAETRFGDSENKPDSGTSLQQMQGSSFPPGLSRLGNSSALQTGKPGVGPASRRNVDGDLQHSSPFCQQYQNLVDGSFTSSSAVELASSPHQQQEHPFAASQVAKKLQLSKSEVGANSLSILRCEMQFPPESIEAKQPILKKRKTLTHRDIGAIDPWRIIMSLRSGLISESSWALDVLSILLRDDFTASAFSLAHMPGLLEVIVEHLRRCLIRIFGDDHFGDLEMFAARKETPPPDTKSFPESSFVKSELSRMLGNHQDFGKSVSDDVGDASDLNDLGRHVTFESSALDWQMGRGDTTVHIITHMASDDVNFQERQFFGKSMDVLRRKRAASDACFGKGSSTEKESELRCRVSRKVKKTAEKTEMSFDFGEICEDDDSNSNIKAVQLGKDRGYDVGPEKEILHQDSLAVDFSTAFSADAKTTDEPEKERNCDVGSRKESACENSFAVGLSTAFSAGGIQLFTCNHLDSLKQMYGEMGEEIFQPEESLICCWDESNVEVAKRCLCLSNILRNLSLISVNEAELSRHRGLVLILSRLLLLHHHHRRGNASSITGTEEDDDGGRKRCWWWATLVNLRENCLVVLASIAGQMDLSVFPESICLPLLDGLLHWSVCRSAEGRDPFPGTSLSVGGLVIETLGKLCVTRANVDLVIATPPFARIVLLLSHLANLVGESHPQATRELALGLMSRIVRADTSAARALALERSAVSFLLEFIEGAEHQARRVAKTQGIEILQDFPETIGTSVDMLCRAADVLLRLVRIPANSGILLRFHHRLLQLVMSQILDCKVTAILAEVLGACNQT